MRIPFIAGNWKMHKSIEEAVQFAKDISSKNLKEDVEVVIFAPFTQLKDLSKAFEGSKIGVGAQNFHFEDKGAFTGEVSAEMILEVGAKYVIIGHSERRQYFGETDETVNLKLLKALKENITPVVCVGESLEEREQEKQFDIIKNQIIKAFENVSDENIEKIVVAYEPIWAIGTGKTATADQANEICAYIRKVISDKYGKELSDKLRIQYGGSVKPSNISEIMSKSDIDGALVGGASLVVDDFEQLVNF